MGWLSVVIAAVAAFMLYGTGHPLLFICAILAAAGDFYSWGIMHNYATEAASQRLCY
jgi:hypothetical protein